MRSSSVRAGVLAGLATALAAGAAGAEFWASSLRDLLRDARSIEEVTVTAVGPAGWTVRVEDSLRGRPAGAVATVQPFWMNAPGVAPGSRALLICDASQCPRAVGVERAGAWVLTAQEPGDGASVMPTLIERRAWRDIAAGRAVPPLCLSVGLSFVDDPGAAESLRVSLAADTGAGSATGAALGTVGAQASLGSRHDSVELVLTTPRGDLHVESHGIAAGLTRAPDGCLALRGTVERPFARTLAELRANVATGNRRVALGRGTLRCARADAPAPCGSTVTLSADDGNLALTLEGAARRTMTVHSMQTVPRTSVLRVGFLLGEDSEGPMLQVDLPAATPASPSLYFGIASALRASAGGRASFAAQLRERGGSERPLGSLDLVRAGP